MNEGKELAEQVSCYVEKLYLCTDVDHRWVSIGKTEAQQAFMALIRSVARPETF